LAYFNAVGEAGSKKIPLGIEKDLGFVLKTAKTPRMDDPVSVTGIGGAKIVTDRIKALVWEHENPFLII
jgi:hypothetical protein